MTINIGIVGLPNVGKSTLFNALASGGAESANFPFCTIEPNVGVVAVPDQRLDVLRDIYDSQTIIPTSIEFVDIAGLVKGASKGEGLGNQFLGHVRAVDAIAHVVRCFDDDNVVHVDGNVDPQRDVEVIDTELALADLDSVERKLDKARKMAKAKGPVGDEAKADVPVLEQLVEVLSEGKPARSLELGTAGKETLGRLSLLTAKPIFFVANVSEDDAADPQSNAMVQKLEALAEAQGTKVVCISAAIESELVELPAEERTDFLTSMGLEEPGLSSVIRVAYSLLGLYTFLTAGPKEVRAWTVKAGMTAPEAAGVIHTDFQRGFIRVEVLRVDDLVALKSEAAVKSAGKMRVEGKDYVVADGDVMHFRFNV